MATDLHYHMVKPAPQLSAFVESFWMLQNSSAEGKDAVILPDGRVDLFFSCSQTEAFHVTLLGIGTRPDHVIIPSHTVTFAVSFKLPAVEYIVQESIADILDQGKLLPEDYWNFNASDLNDFELFCKKVSETISAYLSPDLDTRKMKLFDWLYSQEGAVSIEEISDAVGWSSRQINRYFNQQFGLSLKAYCSILRFRASFQDIKEGKLFPGVNFFDQSHFIREIKRMSGVLPKELHKNSNDRFIQFSTLPKK